MKYGQIWMKKYAERSEAKKKHRTIKRGPKKLNFGASKPGVRGGPGPPPLDPLVLLNLLQVLGWTPDWGYNVPITPGCAQNALHLCQAVG